MTQHQQRALLKKYIAAFLKHQRAATFALRQINEICLNEGDPVYYYDNAINIQGEESLRNYAAGETGPAPFVPGEFLAVIEDAQDVIATNNRIV